MTESELQAHGFSRGCQTECRTVPGIVVVPGCENVAVGYRWPNKTVYSAKYQLIRRPKYPRRVLVGAVEERLKEILGWVARGRSFRLLRAEFAALRRLPCVWTRSLCSAMGGAPLEVVRRCVEFDERME
jgi:putative transposase